MISIFQYLGFVKDDQITNTYPDSFPNEDNLDGKLDYLKALEQQETARMSTIETKSSQLIGMTSIIFSLLGIFIANYFLKFGGLRGGLQFALVFIFIVALLFYINTIFQTTRYLDISKHAYGQRSTVTVKEKYQGANSFKVEEIKDLIFIIERGSQINNRKSNYLIYGYRSFRIATLLIGLLSVLLLFSGYFADPQPNKVQVQNAIQIKNLDTILREAASDIVIPKIIVVHDTVYKTK
jgi:hypothetical protein